MEPFIGSNIKDNKNDFLFFNHYLKISLQHTKDQNECMKILTKQNVLFLNIDIFVRWTQNLSNRNETLVFMLIEGLSINGQ